VCIQSVERTPVSNQVFDCGAQRRVAAYVDVTGQALETLGRIPDNAV
jgi:hypothetical protein